MAAKEPTLSIRAHKWSYLVYGSETKTHRDKFKALGLHWNPTLQGWILNKTKLDDLEKVKQIIIDAGGSSEIREDPTCALDLEMGSQMTNTKGETITVMMLERSGGVAKRFIGNDKKTYDLTTYGWLCLEDLTSMVMRLKKD